MFSPPQALAPLRFSKSSTVGAYRLIFGVTAAVCHNPALILPDELFERA
jgi:hypothetical protein